jgi:CTP synthase
VGISPDLVMVRSKGPLEDEARRKIALFTNVMPDEVFSSHDVEHLYEVPLILEEQGLGRAIERRLELEKVQPNLWFWQDAVKKLKHPARQVEIAFVGKYVAMGDAYLSIIEALRHAGISHDARVRIRWVNAEELEDAAGARLALEGVAGVLVGPGFRHPGHRGQGPGRPPRPGARGALPRHLPRDAGGRDRVRPERGRARGGELDRVRSLQPPPVIDLMPEQLEVSGLGGTMRLGDWPMAVAPGTQLERTYGPGTHASATATATR